jgi:WD40 repeat protein
MRSKGEVGVFKAGLRVMRVENCYHGQLQASLEHEGTVRMVRFSRHGQRLLTASEDGTAVLWDIETGKRAMSP